MRYAAGARPPLDHPKHIDLVEPSDGQLALPIHGPKQPPFAIVVQAGLVQVRVDVGLGEMVRGDFVTLAPLLVEAKPPALPLRVKVLDPHVGDGADAAEGVDHDGDERPIAQADEGLRLDGLEEAARFGAAQDRGLAALRAVLGPFDGGGRVHAEDAQSSRSALAPGIARLG